MSRIRTCGHLDHHQRNGTYLRVLIATPTDVPFQLVLDNDLAIGTTRIVVLAAPSLTALNESTARLQTAARAVDWQLQSADGLHRRIIDHLHHTNTAVPQ